MPGKVRRPNYGHVTSRDAAAAASCRLSFPIANNPILRLHSEKSERPCT